MQSALYGRLRTGLFYPLKSPASVLSEVESYRLEGQR
nr:MAG TPA: hypothetical protein [Caudoviricetes sp.]